MYLFSAARLRLRICLSSVQDWHLIQVDFDIASMFVIQVLQATDIVIDYSELATY